MKQHLKYFLPFIHGFLIVLLAICMLLIIAYIPMYYDWFKGDQIVEAHIKEVIGNKTDDAEITQTLMQWVHDNVEYPNVNKKVKKFGIDFYIVHNETKFFWRDVPASWTILRKMGMCGEDANYFVGVMDQLGYKARTIEPRGKNHWDHAWAEYYTKDGTKIVLDPSNNHIISPNLKEWTENKTFTKILAIDLEGNKEDVTKEYTG